MKIGQILTQMAVAMVPVVAGLYVYDQFIAKK